jgi:[ribosomal protein S5]-alanine N-acetyltransferase
MQQMGLDNFPNLSTTRLTLRQLQPSDEREIFSLRSNPEVNKHLDRDPANTLEDAADFINKILTLTKDKQTFYWAICLKENPKLIGTICYFNRSAQNESAEIGYELHPFYQGRGIMQEAMSVVIPFGFEVMQLKLIIACPSEDNLSSIKLLEKDGFKLDQDQYEKEGNLVRYVLSALTFYHLVVKI